MSNKSSITNEYNENRQTIPGCLLEIDYWILIGIIGN